MEVEVLSKYSSTEPIRPLIPKSKLLHMTNYNVFLVVLQSKGFLTSQ